ncbi:MAG: hypothetical protein D6714_19325 [Bacteroidetes bacterium]|nr:MAG: hypothetical protein D6714_19325 [Bacteroidota bacterium]
MPFFSATTGILHPKTSLRRGILFDNKVNILPGGVVGSPRSLNFSYFRARFLRTVWRQKIFRKHFMFAR